ncbi:MAG TPA: hypothetical protein VGG22_11585 [Candidatus Baltobacteraceae bacterium]|jgi:hypothetical protein
MTESHDFFVASVGAAAALVGLLFVAVTLAPERIFGPEAHPKRRADATRAFVALGNIFLISLAALIPHAGLEIMLLVSVLSIGQLAREAVRSTRHHPLPQVLRSFGLISLLIYIFEIVIILQAMTSGRNIDGLLGVIFGLFAYALATSWNLLGAKELPGS